MKFEQWKGFEQGDWQSEINVRDYKSTIITSNNFRISFVYK